MGEPVFDYAQTLRFFRMLYRHGDRYFLWAYRATGGDALYSETLLSRLERAKGGWHLESSYGEEGFEHFDDASTPVLCEAYRQNVRNELVRANIIAKLEVAASVPTYGLIGRKTEANAVHLGAFGIDVDPKNFEAIVPGGDKAAVMAAVVKTLAARGISQHAIVDSGNGFHVYLAIEHLNLRQEDHKDRAKLVWKKLCTLLGGSTDRHDLASVLRVPGSFNWKGGVPKPVFFVEEHCDLNKPRYRLRDLEEALADVEVPLPSNSDTNNEVVGAMAEAQTELLDLALSVDKQLRACLESAKAGDVGVRSQADFNLGCRMFRLGLPENLVRHIMSTTAKALSSRNPNRYASLTVSRCKDEVISSNSPTSEDTWMVVNNSPQSLHKYDMDHHNRVVWGVGKQAAPSDGGDGDDGSNSDQTVRVVVVLARPGDGKTMDLLDELSHKQRVPGVQLAVCGGLTRELLRHEHVINASFPSGFTDSSPGDVLGAGPENSNELFDRLPTEVQQHWTAERLQKAGVDLHGFLLNSLHPRDADRRLEPNLGPEDDEKEELDRLRARPQLPAAVLKFKAQRRWCLAGHSSRKLQGDPGICSRCPLVACRANTSNNEYERGAKTYWPTASVQLLTHRAYQFQEAFKPGKNHFDTLVFDELPDFVYRASELEISPKDFRGKHLTWNVKYIDPVLDALRALPHADGPTVADIVGALRAGREFLTALAARRRQAIIAGTDGHRCWRVDKIKPLLGSRQFQTLLQLLRSCAQAEAHEGAAGLDDDDDIEDEGRTQLSDALLVLRDFCSDAPNLSVLMEDGFDDAKAKVAEQVGSFYVMRPVNGWREVLGAQGPERHQHRVLLDATAGIDPRYMLAGQFHEEQFPTASFPGTTVVITDQTSRTGVKKLNENAVVEQIIKDIYPYGYRIEKGLLVLCNKAEAARFNEAIQMAARFGRLPAKTRVAHFGALRGRNDLADLDSVYFLNPFRLPPRCYVGLDLLLSNFKDAPRQWQQTNKRGKNEVLLARCLAADIYQDAMRIKLRKEPASRCMVFLPIKKLPAVVTRLARLFQDATFIVDGVEMRSSKASITLTDWLSGLRAAAVKEQSLQDEDDLSADKKATTWTDEQHQYFRGQINCFFRPRARTEIEADQLLEGFWQMVCNEERGLLIRSRGDEEVAWAEISTHLEPFMEAFREANRKP